MLVLALFLIILSSCESGAKFRVVNRSTHPLYITLEGKAQVVIPGSEPDAKAYNEHTFDIDTDTQSFFTGTVKESKKVIMVGETYHIFDDVNDVYTDTTTVTFKAGETLSAFINPNRASIKIINNCSQKVSVADVYRHNYVSNMRIGSMTDIESGTNRFLRVEYVSPGTSFYYYVEVIMENGNQYMFNDQRVLQKDEQLLLVLEDPL